MLMKPNEFASLLFEIEVNAHIAHLQVTGPGSYAQHGALNELYQAMPELRDAFIEPYQGQYGIIKGYKNVAVQEGVDFVKYLDEKIKAISAFRNELEDGYLEQLVDNILEQLNGTKYKLTFLK